MSSETQTREAIPFIVRHSDGIRSNGERMQTGTLLPRNYIPVGRTEDNQIATQIRDVLEKG